MALRIPALRQRGQRQQQAKTMSVPAPVGGWNDRDPLSAMDPKCAVILDNMFCLPSMVINRKGSAPYTTGLISQVESLMAYKPTSGTGKLFAAAGTSFFDVTAGGAVGAAVVTGLSNARWQYANEATSGGNFLMAVNGADKLRGYNGTSWWIDGDGSHDITGPNTAQCIDLCLFKRRMWLVQENSTSVWYGPVDGIAGTFTQFDFGSIFERGGQIVKMVDWSIDAGIGVDDYAAFISNQGEVALYKGTDPSSATTWALVGIYYIGAPVSQRCAVQYGTDVLIVSQDGLIPLSKALMTGRLLTNVALTDQIQNSISNATTLYGSSFGWQIFPFPGENMIILNVPVGVGQQQQYVMNTISGAWSRFKGWAANCFELFNGIPYFGANGAVYQAWTTSADNGSNINFEALQAFNYFGIQENLKEFTLARPLVSVTNNIGLVMGMNTDFDMTAPTGVPTFVQSTAGKWGSALWGSGLWGGNPVIQKAWQTVFGIGRAGAPHLVGASNNGQLQWSATDYAFKLGGII